ncbi:primary-amine oxidase [Terrabacter sp. BE26]|uniref:primary-amine oxidase n=1 Tax=Terrabacter sp. BE26 TaxID=2898152 RepID=UPI0035BE9FDF
MASSTIPTTATTHPLSPLTAEEVKAATEILIRSGQVPAGVRFVSVSLHEPPKAQVLAWDGASGVDREAFTVVYDRARRQVYEAVVSITRGEVVRGQPVPGAMPSYLLEEVYAVIAVVKADPRWQEAMRRRGVTDLSLAHIDPWPGAWLSETDPGDRRVCRALTWVRPPVENGHPYARPVEGLVTLVDFDRMEVVDVSDTGVVPIPQSDGEYVPELLADAGERNRPKFAGLRADVRPLEITQPEGPSWRVDGHQVSWQKWRFVLGWSAREGIVLSDVRYDDRGELRPVLYRASVSEMVVPYGDPAPTHGHKLAFDEGEAGLGLLVTPLTLGCDCLGVIQYFDGLGVDQDGNPLDLPNAICMHEEDVGIAWKHFDYQRETTEVRRMRRLVISSIINLSNYEYGFFWYLYQDGSIEFEVKLTGVLSTGAYRPGEKPRHGTAVAPGLYAPNHQHFFCVRLDADIDGQANTVVEVNSEAVPMGPENPYGTAWRAVETPLLTEQAAQRNVHPESGRFWRIMNPAQVNEMGAPVSYRLHPGDNVSPFMHEDSPMRQRALFATKHLWVTPYDPRERYAAGNYPWQNPGPDGLPRWTDADRSIDNTDVVLWYVVGTHHVPRVEEWPVMPVAKAGFHLVPDGFFDGNPALDLPRPSDSDHRHGP